ncbi:MAG: hypothetical protein AABX89_03780 [Candidatus Thermoplasmatota archaeon]
MGVELTGSVAGTGAKMKAELGDGVVSFRGAFKAEVPFKEIVAESRGSLLMLTVRGHVVSLAAGSKAASMAAKIRAG